MFKKFYHSLGDTPWEFLVNLLLLILISPIWLLFSAIIYVSDFLYRLLGMPEPKQIPIVIGDKPMPDEQKASTYLRKLKECIKDASFDIDADMQVAKIHTKRANVEMWREQDIIGISIDGLNTGFWHSDEEPDLDMMFWTAVGALRNGIKWKRNWIGRKEGWVYSDEMEIWVVVSAGKGVSEYSKFRRHFKD